MYMRLAFAVAAHLEPEILIVDEVLAVGDMEFQKKCLGKMEHITGQQGRTVLFVSHNMDLISKLCSKAILLNAGNIEIAGKVEQVTHTYLNRAAANFGKFTSERAGRSLLSVTVDEDALKKEKLILKVCYKFHSQVINPTIGMVIYTETGSPIFGSNTMYHPPASKLDKAQSGEAAVIFEHLPLWSGRYRVSIWLSDSWSPIDFQENAITFDFLSSSSPLNAPNSSVIGPIHLPAVWTINKKTI
jgi:lipopolysaccharide transport system ATP-binding protein